MNVANNLAASAAFFPDRPAVQEGAKTLTYAALNDQANRIATGLVAMGIRPGDLVALCTPNSADWIAFYFGVLKTGAVAVTLSGVLTGDELINLVNHARPRFMYTAESKLADLQQAREQGTIEKIICPGGDVDLARLVGMGSGFFKTVDRDRMDTAAILYTGGTTGIPKGVMLTHEHVNFSGWAIAYYERSVETDRGLCFLPFNHVFGQLHIMNATILSAGCLELLPAFDLDKVLELMEEGRVSKFFAVPTVYTRLLALGDLEKRMAKVRYCFSAGASLAIEIVRQWRERTGITIAESYGMTECMPITFNHYYPEHHVVGSVGQPVRQVEVRIMDTSGRPVEDGREGEICVRGRNVMKGYLNNPEGTKEAFWEGGWLRTGDIGVVDEAGFITIVDRLKDLIITGGENVFPREVEEAIYAWPEVEQCAVIGVPDKEWGERVAAFIVTKEHRSLSTEDLKVFLKGRLSPFKVPKEYVIMADLPKSPTGKILKREIRKQVTGKKG